MTTDTEIIHDSEYLAYKTFVERCGARPQRYEIAKHSEVQTLLADALDLEVAYEERFFDANGNRLPDAVENMTASGWYRVEKTWTHARTGASLTEVYERPSAPTNEHGDWEVRYELDLGWTRERTRAVQRLAEAHGHLWAAYHLQLVDADAVAYAKAHPDGQTPEECEGTLVLDIPLAVLDGDGCLDPVATSALCDQYEAQCPGLPAGLRPTWEHRTTTGRCRWFVDDDGACGFAISRSGQIAGRDADDELVVLQGFLSPPSSSAAARSLEITTLMDDGECMGRWVEGRHVCALLRLASIVLDGEPCNVRIFYGLCTVEGQLGRMATPSGLQPALVSMGPPSPEWSPGYLAARMRRGD